MRILLVHNHYGSSAPSGENVVFALERNLLVSRGHEVGVLERHSDEILAQGTFGKLRGAMTAPWNPATSRRMRRLIADLRPNVVHVHNTFPLVSAAVFPAAHGASRVLTLHNYRLFCAAAVPMRRGRVCTQCLDNRTVLPALQHGCYRDSRLSTFPVAASVALHRWRRTWYRDIEAFITLSDFQRDVMINAGLPGDRVYTKPNFYPGSPAVVPWRERKPYVVFAGRLSREKGVVSLLQAWQMLGGRAPELRIIGAGPLREELIAMSSGLKVRFLGQVSSQEAQNHIADARLLILPSECFEGFPMVVREAFAFGTPVATSDLGPLPSIVRGGQNGMVFRAVDPEDLAKTVRSAWEMPGELERLGRGARREFEAKYNEDANYDRLMEIYRSAMEHAEIEA